MPGIIKSRAPWLAGHLFYDEAERGRFAIDNKPKQNAGMRFCDRSLRRNSVAAF
jgi:hypothetical protein